MSSLNIHEYFVVNIVAAIDKWEGKVIFSNSPLAITLVDIALPGQCRNNDETNFTQFLIGNRTAQNDGNTRLLNENCCIQGACKRKSLFVKETHCSKITS